MRVVLPVVDCSDCFLEFLEASDSDTDLTEATTNINASIEEYRIEIFPTSTEAFSYQHAAQQRLEGAEPNASSDIDAARADIHLASNISARIAANEAYRLVTEHEFTHSSYNEGVPSSETGRLRYPLACN